MKNVLILIFLLWQAVSCTSKKQLSNELRNTQLELEEVKKERDMYMQKVQDGYDVLERERYQWMDQNYKLQQKVKKMEEERRANARQLSRATWLEEENERLKTRIKNLSNNLGPGIWVWDVVMDQVVFGYQPENPTLEGIIKELNKDKDQGQGLLLSIQKVEGDVVFIKADYSKTPNSIQGSYGANVFVQETLFSLTSVSGINCIYLDIEESDHLSPGKICK